MGREAILKRKEKHLTKIKASYSLALFFIFVLKLISLSWINYPVCHIFEFVDINVKKSQETEEDVDAAN